MTVRDPEEKERGDAADRGPAIFTHGRKLPWVILTVVGVAGALFLPTASPNGPRSASPSAVAQVAQPHPTPDAAAPDTGSPLTGDSTLARWLAATADERTPIAVALARNLLKPDASKLEIARAAMEITGCLTRTAKDPKLSAWRVAPTANICLTAPERPQ